MARIAGSTGAVTSARALDVAQRLVQTLGFAGFTYAQVAEEMGISKASLHYHFAGKADLGLALIARYAMRFRAATEEISAADPPAPAALAEYVLIIESVLRDGRMCLCGMLAADYGVLSEPMRTAVIDFFDDNERWLADVLDGGRHRGELAFEGSAREAAQVIIGGLEGAMLLARPFGDVDRFETVATRLIRGTVGADIDPAQVGSSRDRGRLRSGAEQCEPKCGRGV